jgi:hypothetical protein
MGTALASRKHGLYMLNTHTFTGTHFHACTLMCAHVQAHRHTHAQYTHTHAFIHTMHTCMYTRVPTDYTLCMFSRSILSYTVVLRSWTPLSRNESNEQKSRVTSHHLSWGGPGLAGWPRTRVPEKNDMFILTVPGPGRRQIEREGRGGP